MRLFLDKRSVALFALRTALDNRRYYCAEAPIRAIIVCRHGLSLPGLAGQVVDARIGNDAGWREFVREANVDQQHTKITIYRVLPGARAKRTLSQVLRDAPRDNHDGQ